MQVDPLNGPLQQMMKGSWFGLAAASVFWVFASAPVLGQYGNEWVTFGQTYYKIPVTKNGIHMLTYADLQAAGFPVSSVDPRRLQLFYRGAEQAMLVEGQDDAVLNDGDYLEFYGRKNDGQLDASLYSPSSVQPHQFYSLYTDTAYYYLTWNLGAVLGKRMNKFKEVNVSGLPAQASHQNQVLTVLSSEYCLGNTQNTFIQYSHFDEGEGWTGSTICTQNVGCIEQRDYQIEDLINGVTALGLPQLEIQLHGRDVLQHTAEIHVGPSSGSLRLLTTHNFANFQTPIVTQPLNWSDIGGDGKMIVRVKGIGVGGARERMSVGYIKVSHPQNFAATGMTEKSFRLNADSNNKSYVVFTNPPANTRFFDITDNNTPVLIETTVSGSNLTAIVPNTATSRELFASNVAITPSLKPVTFRQMNPANPNFIIISHPALMKPGLGYANPVQAYGGYRASPAGGGYDTLVVSINQLYDQFNYGETSPRAIYQFMKWMVDNGDPQYLFIIGKGLNIEYQNPRVPPIPGEPRNLVPPAGSPSSDLLFTAGINGPAHVPAVATGRISANTPGEVAAYLNKVMETEALPFTDLWRKNVLHLSGGILPAELTAFKSYVDGFGDIAEGYFYGGQVATIAKQEPNPVELINIAQEVNNGVNLITFFGHSSPGTIDIDIGFATDPILGYNNASRYPAFIINGCNAGVFTSKSKAFGEDWILAANKGARNFIAHSSFGFSSALRAYTEMFYQVGFSDAAFTAKGIGDVQKEVARIYLEAYGTSIGSVTQVQQMALLGDPSLKLFGAGQPDYEIEESGLSLYSYDEKPVTALTDSFAIQVIVKNYGLATLDPLTVRVARTFGDNTVVTYDSTFQSVKTLDTLLFKLKREPGKNGFGNNVFEVVVDYNDDVIELNEGNNAASLSLFIPLSGTKHVFPPPYGIVNSQQLTLQFYNTNLLTAEREYLVELDTVSSFNSGYLLQHTVTGGVLNSQAVVLLGNDSLVYYWRTKLANPQPGESTEWTVSSFAYIANGAPGWAQLKFEQYLENGTDGLMLDPVTESLSYETSSADLLLTTYGGNHPSPHTAVSLKINNIEFNIATQGLPCRDNTLNLVAFDKSTLVPYAGIPFKFQDPRTCGREPQLINSFAPTELETGNQDDLFQYIDNLDVSDSVVLFSIGDAGYASWSGNVLAKLQELGISNDQLSTLQPGEPFIMLGRKGAASGTAKVFRPSGAPLDEQELILNETLTGRLTTGSMTSVVVGPAQSWQSFSAGVKNVQPSDQFSFDVFGLDNMNGETLLFSGLVGDQDLSGVDATAFPRLRINFNTTDEVDLSPAQLRQWLVLYEPTAEGIVTFTGDPAAQVRQEGESFSTTFAFVNISNQSFPDSLTVQLETFNRTSREKETQIFKIAPPVPGDSIHFQIVINTVGKVGLNDISVMVNPNVLPEQIIENNLFELNGYLDVFVDAIKPVLDVRIDGRMIENRDYVSSTPEIEITVWDENKLILKSDTTGMRLLLQYPCDLNCSPTEIFFSRPDVSWTAASDSTDFHIAFAPEKLDTGTYVLFVEAADASGNSPGATYQVEFRVSDEAQVYLDNPYPNPAVDEVHFEVTFTSEVLPEYSLLEIHDAQGRIVSERHPSGYHTGKNILRWDGTDFSGSHVPNGLYLYRYTIQLQGKKTVFHGRVIMFR